MFDFLQGFESRMRLVSVVQAIISRRGTNRAIEDQFEGKEYMMENLLIMVLVYLMDKKLSYNEEATIENIETFLKTVMQDFDIIIEDYHALAYYIIRDVLQNKGERRYYKIFDSNKGYIDYSFVLVSDRANENNKLVYQLTDVAYDFLFRTKEVDSEIGFSVEIFKTKEFIKRQNYSKALEQSMELIKRIREQKVRIYLFMQRCRENIAKVTMDEYESVTKSTHALLNEEYEELEQLRRQVISAGERIEQRLESEEEEKSKKHAKDIIKILQNLDITIAEQKRLINQSYSLEDFYKEKIEDSFYQHQLKRFQIEETLMKPIETLSTNDVDKLLGLLRPLYKPEMKRHSSLMTYYQRQQKIKEIGEKIQLDVETLEDHRDLLAISRNNRFMKIIEHLFYFFKDCAVICRIGDFIDSLKEETILELMVENSLMHVLLKLYDIGVIDFTTLRISEEEMILTPYGEFDLLYCLSNLNCSYDGLERVIFTKVDDEIKEIELVTYENTDYVEINDFVIEVKRNES